VAVYEFPTSFGQRQMWLLAELDSDEPTYNVAWALWLDGPLEASALQLAWDAALARHEALRTTFKNESGVPVQVIEDEPVTQPLATISVEHLAADEREPAAIEAIREVARAPMDLAAGPLVRAALVRLSPESHVLAVVMHHIVADGWSFRILFDELSADYEALSLGASPLSEEPPIQYADFALWQLEHADDGGFVQDGRFWRTELADAPASMPLPTDEPYPTRQTFAARSIAVTIAPGLAGALREVAARHQTTLFAVLLTAYSVVLARLTGSDDLLISVPMAARTRPETESVVGLFMNSVPIRIKVDQDETLSDLVRAVHAAATRALAHHELPFGNVVELIKPDRDPARLPLAQVQFALEESWALPERGGLRWRPELIENGTAKFELELKVTDTPAGPQVRVNYNSDLFHPATGQLVADSFTSALRRLADDADLVVADADLMSPDDLVLVTSIWPDGGPLADPDATALAQLWAACDRHTVVASGSDGELTGRQVRSLARRIAAAIRSQGVGIGDRVAILLPRGARLLPALLGTWSVGASYVPLDSIYPDRRLVTMLNDSGAAAIIVDSNVPDAPGLPPGAAPIPVVDLKSLTAAEAYPLLDLPATATAVTLFTSGSTGRPKAVSVTQGGIGALLASFGPQFALGPADRMLAVHTFAFDVSVLELLAPVLAGGRVVIADTDQVLDAARLRELLVNSGTTALQMTPAGWRMLVDAGGPPAEVKLRISGGDKLPRDLGDAICTGDGVRLWHMYGPTETTIYSGGAIASPSPAKLEIGSNIAGNQHYVLDSRLRPVPPGVFGEMYIGGACVANGYHGAPGQTASRFIPDSFSGRPGARLYRSGDVGRWLRSGRFELTGRADRQIKIRGYRIECGEVEAALLAHDDVAQAVATRRGPDTDVRLVAYIVTRSGADTEPAGLRDDLRQVLPDYMVPSAVVVLPALPLSGNRKIDHRALPEPNWGESEAQASVAPRTPVESRLAAMVAELLTLPAPVGVTDNFFALGGHSLTATRLMASIRSVYGVELPVRTLFSDPTVAGLAAALAAAGSDRR
jgi:amino acid adenylation domain-containing protein